MNAIIPWKGQPTLLLALWGMLGATCVVTACQGGGGDASDSGGNLGGSDGLAGSGNSGDGTLDSDAVVELARKAAEMSEDDLYAAIAAADLDAQMGLAGPSGLITELGGEASARAAWAAIGAQMKTTADQYAAGMLFDSQQSQSAPKGALFDLTRPRARVQADNGGGSLGEAFGAGWLGGSLFNVAFLGTVIGDYSDGKSGLDTDKSSSGDVTATAGLTDTLITLDATANFTLNGLKATIKTHSGIPCPDATGLLTINSSLDVTGKAGNAFQSARFSFELIVDVDDDATLTGRNQLTSRTEAHTADSSRGYETTDRSADVSVTEFADGHFGDGKGSYQGMTEKDALGWMNLGLMSGDLYRKQLLPKLQKMLDAGRCVNITVEPSAGPMNLEPFTNVDLLTKPRAKTDGRPTEGTVEAKFKVNAGGAIAELGSKVPADATFHYVAPLDHNKTETVTFQARSRRGTGKLDYTLTTSPHAD